MSDLSPDQQEKLVQFQDITAYNDEDYDKVIRLLKVTNWNLDVAITRFFDNDFPTLLDHHEFSGGSNNPFTNTASEVPSAGPFDIPMPIPEENGFHAGTSPERPSFQSHDFVDHPYTDLLPQLPRAGPIENKWKFSVGLNGYGTNSNALGNNQNRVRRPLGVLAPIVFVLMLFPKLIWVVGFGLDKLLGPLFPALFRFLGLRESLSGFPKSPIYPAIQRKRTTVDYLSYLKEEKEESEQEEGNKNEDDDHLCTFKEYFERVISEPTDLDIFTGEFNEAFNLAKNELRWLMTVLVNSKSDLSLKFLKQFLNNESFLKFVKENNIILYCGDVCYPEPFEVGKSYNVYKLPYINLISNVSATGTTFPSMSLVTKCQNFESFITNTENNDTLANFSKKLIKRLQKIVDKYEPQLITQRYDKREAEFSRMLRQQQDEAYEQSLIKDKQRQEERQKEKQQRLWKLRRESLEADLKELSLRKREYFLISNIQKIFNPENEDSSTWKKGEYTTLQLRNHEGIRIIQKFKRNQYVYDIFVFVECKLHILKEARESGRNEDQVVEDLLSKNLRKLEIEYSDILENIDLWLAIHDEEYQVEYAGLENLKDGEFRFSFDLVSPMPRHKLNYFPFTHLEDNKELWPNGNILIEFCEDYEDSD